MDKRRKSRPKYSNKWRKTSVYCLRQVKDECVMCNESATLVHHAFYGSDVCGWSIFPLCEKCHEISHLPQFWINNQNEIFARNTREFIQILRAKYYYAYRKNNLWRFPDSKIT